MTFPVDKRNRTSVLNSTTTLLTAGSTFTGEWEDVSQYDSVVVAAKTDQDGTYTVQFSPDGVNVDSTLTRYYRTANINPPHRFTVTRDYVRITFENISASDQTYLRLQTTFGEKTELNAPLDSVLPQDFDAISVRPSSYDIEVVTGRRQNQTQWNKFGYDEAVSNSTFGLVWSNSGTWTRLPTAQTLSVVSTSTNDTSGGTGVNSIVIYGVGADWVDQIEVLTMNGTTPVVTTNTWLGVNRIAVFLSGTGNKNAGVITATGSTSATIQAEIPTDTEGGSVTQQCLFFVPANHVFVGEYIRANAVKLSGGGQPVITVKGLVYSAVNNTIQEVFRESIDVQVNSSLSFENQKFPVGEKSILYFMAKSDTATSAVRMRFGGKLIKDVDA